MIYFRDTGVKLTFYITKKIKYNGFEVTKYIYDSRNSELYKTSTFVNNRDKSKFFDNVKIIKTKKKDAPIIAKALLNKEGDTVIPDRIFNEKDVVRAIETIYNNETSIAGK